MESICLIIEHSSWIVVVITVINYGCCTTIWQHFAQSLTLNRNWNGEYYNKDSLTFMMSCSPVIVIWNED